MKKRAVIIRLVCYLLMLAAVLSWPVRKIMYYDFPEIPPQEFLFPVKHTEFPDSLRRWDWVVSLPAPAENQKIPEIFFVTLRKDNGGAAVPQKIYCSRKEIPAGVPFIRVHLINQYQGNVSFYISSDCSFLFHGLKKTLPPDFSAGELRLRVKVYPDGSFRTAGLLSGGKQLNAR